MLRGEDINADTATALASLGPFGSGNPRPRLLLVDAGIRQPEATRTGSHLRCQVEVDGVRTRAIGFGMGEMAASLRDDGDGRVVGVQLRVDEWQGTLRPEFLLERVGAAAGDGKALCECGPGCPAWTVTGAQAAPGGPSFLGRSDSPAMPFVPEARDLRDRPGRAGAIAQVVAGGERTVILTCSVAHVPRGALGRDPPGRAEPGRVGMRGPRVPVRRMASESPRRRWSIVEWDAAARLPGLLMGEAARDRGRSALSQGTT